MVIFIRNAWNGGDYRLCSFGVKRGGAIGINAHEKLIEHTRLTLQKKHKKNEEISSKLKTIKDELNKRMNNLQKEMEKKQ